jgi:Clr5 domain
MDHAGSAGFTSWSTGALFVGHDPQLPVQADWVRFKGVIHALYIEKNLPLKDVRAIMEREHSFKATYVCSSHTADWCDADNLGANECTKPG